MAQLHAGDSEAHLAHFEAHFEERLLLLRGRNHYKLLARIGHSKEGSVYKAKYLPDNILVAIKIYDPYKVDDREEYARQLFLAHLFRRENFVNVFCRFKYEDHVWVVMDYMAVGSVKSIMVNYFPNGLSEPSIACILEQIIISIKCRLEHINYRNLNLGYLYIDANGDVKVGCDVMQYEDLENQLDLLFPIPHWAYAPEVKRDESIWEYCELPGTWMVGVTALQLAYGGLPASNERDWDLLIQNITAQYGPKRRKRRIRILKIPKYVKKFMTYNNSVNNSPGVLPIPKHGKKLSKSFWEMVALCFQRPRERPYPRQLTSHEFFTKNCSKFDDPREPFAQEVLSMRSSSLDSQEFQHQEGVDDEWSFHDELSRSSSFSFSS